MVFRILLFLSVVECALGFLIDPFSEKPRLPKRPDIPHKYRVFVFGDSYGAFAPGWGMLQDLFDRHGVDAIVDSKAYYGSTACRWADKNNKNMAEAATHRYNGTTGPDFVWFTSGGNDLLEDEHLACQRKAKTWEEAVSCALEQAAKTARCNKILLKNFFEVWPNAQVMQSSYTLSCMEDECMPFHKWNYCRPGKNITCANELGSIYLKATTEPLKEFFGEQYSLVIIAAAAQVSARMPGATLDHPLMSEGSPCEEMINCWHPRAWRPGSFQVMDVFWEYYFSKKMEFDPDYPVQKPNVRPLPKGWENQEYLEVGDVFCNRDYYPDMDDPNMPEPPCNYHDNE